MFRGPSWFQRARVALLLIVNISAGTIILPHADGTDDAACSPVAVAHDESAHYIGAESASPDESAHCFLCHSFRTFYPAFDRFQQHQYTPRTERLHCTPIDRARMVAWTLVSGRAPPV